MSGEGESGPSRRLRWAIAIPIGTVLGIVLTLGFWSLTGSFSNDKSQPSSEITVAVAETDRPVDPAAVWALGFDVVRLDPQGGDPAQRLGRSVGGNVIGVDGALYWYTGPSGEVTKLDTRRNRLTERRDPLPGYAPTDELESLAANRASVYLVTGTAEVTRVDAETLETQATIDLEVDNAIDTWVVAGDAGVHALTATATQWTIARLDEHGIDRQESIQGFGRPLGMAEDDGLIWIYTADMIHVIDTTTLQASGHVVVPPDVQPLSTAVAFAGKLWFIANTGEDVYSASPSGTELTRIPVVDRAEATFRPPVSIASGRGSVWAMLQASDDPDRHDAVVARIDPATNRVAARVTMPSELFAGAIAVS